MANTPSRPVLTREQADGAVKRLRELLGNDASRIVIEHNARSVLQLANNKVLDGTNGAELTVQFGTVMGTAETVTIGTNQLDDNMLRAIASQVAALRSAPPNPNTVPSDDPDSPAKVTYGAEENVAMPVSLWRDETVAAMAQPPAAVADVIPKMKKAGLLGSATMALSVRSTFYSYSEGLNAWAEETDAEITVSARSSDGLASGWAGQANRNASKLDWDQVTDTAIDFAQRSRNPVAMEPGRYTTILGPAAVGQLARIFSTGGYFDWYGTYNGNGPFADVWSPSRTKLGQRVFDERLRMVSDPADPDGGYVPFYEMPSSEAGLPFEKTPWIENGVLKNLSYGPYFAAARRKPRGDLPYSMRLEAMPGVQTNTIEEMIAHCEMGIYVNRLSDVNVIRPLPIAMSTGVTRDGCFLIKNGKISQPLRNFRFLESPFQLMARIMMIGPTQRVAFGHTTMTEGEMWNAMIWPPLGSATRWPRVPMIVPPLMIQDFNFSSLATAV